MKNLYLLNNLYISWNKIVSGKRGRKYSIKYWQFSFEIKLHDFSINNENSCKFDALLFESGSHIVSQVFTRMSANQEFQYFYLLNNFDAWFVSLSSIKMYVIGILSLSNGSVTSLVTKWTILLIIIFVIVLYHAKERNLKTKFFLYRVLKIY